MSVGSGASNLGYGSTYPNSNVNGGFINKDNSHYAGGFGSNEVPGLPGLAGAKYNVDAAAAYVPGLCMKGGRRRGFKSKIKNITKRYKMSKSKKRGIRKRIKSTLSRALSRSRNQSRSRGLALALAGGRKRKHKTQKGGYGQYMNNMPVDRTFSVGGLLNAGSSALASPPPIRLLAGSGYDNYNHYNNTTFPSRGH
jgi:hypothetical protein